MKCEKCGFEYDDTLATCPNCSSVEIEAVSLNPAADKVLGMLKDGLFLAICILISGASVFSVATGGLPLLHILMSVFLWLAYAQGRKGFADQNHLRCVSGTLYANYVITNVSSIIVIVLGALLGFVWQVISGMDIIGEIIDEITGIVGSEYTYFVESIFNISGYIILAIFVGIGIIMLLINVLGFSKIHRLAKSIYQSVDFCVLKFENVKGAKNWMIVFAVFNLISAAGSLIDWDVNASVTSVCAGVSMLFGSILVDRYLVEK